MSSVARVEAKRYTRAELLRRAPRYDALAVRIETQVDRTLIDRARRLKCVATATTGIDHIDAAYLLKKGIPLFSLNTEHSLPTAEHALSLMMSLARNVAWAHQAMVKGGWRRWQYVGVELAGKTLGIYGIGRIGTLVAQKAAALGMRVLAYDPYLTAREAARRGGRRVGWSEFLRSCDFFSLHAPLTKETQGRFDGAVFMRMKRFARIVNTARGAIIDEKALLRALSEDRIRSAAIDVYPEEPLPAGHPLRRYARTHANLLLTPHLGGSTQEAKKRASMQTAKALVGFFKRRG
ncbi:MAG: hydroxyacid dehydrogenase [Elusimicrobia bacterium]|nr:hydroxyacid dehydrogenase [Elusimicrobiota bacterium]